LRKETRRLLGFHYGKFSDGKMSVRFLGFGVEWIG
jgi:hypothetical protein